MVLDEFMGKYEVERADLRTNLLEKIIRIRRGEMWAKGFR